MTTSIQLTLHDDSGDPVSVEVTSLDREPSGAVAATFQVSTDTWDHINADELFHTAREQRSGDVDGRFEAGRPVDIEVVLDKLVVDSLGLADASAEEIRSRLGSLKKNSLDDFLLSARSWYARSVTQEVPLPDELADIGTVSQGFRVELPDFYNHDPDSDDD